MKILNILLGLLLFSQSVIAADQIVVATADGIPLSMPDGKGFHDQVIQEAFNRINIGLQIIHLPAERALINANEGIEQGVYVRVEGLDNVYKNLRRVPEKITDYRFVAFSKKKNLLINNWDSTAPFDVGIINGWKILEKNIKKYNSLVKVSNPTILFNILVEDKVDLIVYNEHDGYGHMKENGITGIYPIQPPFAQKEMFLYLHKDKESLIPALTKALKSIKEDGTYEKIKTITLSPYLPK